MLHSLANIPPDPILEITKLCQGDSNPRKVDLGVGVYRDEAGNVPVMSAIRAAAEQHIEELQTYTYVTPPGNAVFLEHFPTIPLGTDTDVAYTAVASNSGTGALSLLATLIRMAKPETTVWLPKPTWGNHEAIFTAAGLSVQYFPYYDLANHEVAFEPMMAKLSELGPDDVVLLHGSCQNPVGADPSVEQWQQIADLGVAKGFNVLIDVAYQGLGEGLELDARGIRIMAKTLPRLFIAQSASKIFGVYGLRAGAAIVCSTDEEERTKAFGNLNQIARAQYSMTSSYGAELVARVLSSTAYKAEWMGELEAMGTRIRHLRKSLAQGINDQLGNESFNFIIKENGMFSYLGFSKEQMHDLRADYSIYGLNSGRINIAGLNEGNLAYVIDSVAAVAKATK